MSENNNSLEKKILETLSSNLRALRKARGWSQAELAQAIGVHLSHISRVELGVYMPSLDFAFKIAQVFGVSLETLFSNEKDILQEATSQNTTLNDRLKMIEHLDKPERDALTLVIDSVIAKHKIKHFLEEKPLAS